MSASEIKVHNLRCEYRVNPLGIDALKPRLSWALQSDRRDVMQQSYHVLVASSPELLARGAGDLWDSGVMESDQSIQVVYAGEPLSSRQQAFWKVRLQTNHGAETESQPALWTMGLLNSVDWQGQWIGMEEAGDDNSFDHEIVKGELVIRKAVYEGEDASMDLTDLLNSRIKDGILAVTIKPEALGVEDPGGKKQLTVDYEYNGQADTLQTPYSAVLGDIYLPRGTIFMDTPAGMEDRRRWPVSRHLRREFLSEGTVKRATLYATALGVYEFHINGERVGNHILAPEWTDYKKRIQYQTYEVTSLLKTGNNAVSAVLGNGWFCGGMMFWRTEFHSAYGRDPHLLAQLEIEYEDGSSSTIRTDGTWRGTTDGPIRFSGIYEGEIYDARREMPGWDRPGFDDSKWNGVAVRGPDANAGDLGFEVGQLVWQRNEPIRHTLTLHPSAVTEPRPGVFVIDMGQMMPGWIQLKVDEPEATRLTLQHGEMLNPDGTVYVDNLRAGHFASGDRMVHRHFCKGGGETVEPHFTYHGFQYVEVHGLQQKPCLEDVKGIVLHSDFRKAGSFSSSNSLLDQFLENAQWTQRNTFHGIPTACNGRDERCGYTGDMNFFMPIAVYNFDVAAFFNKWCMDLEDAQLSGGWFPDHAPHYGPGKGPHVGWSDAGVICPYSVYREYGDVRVIEEHFQSMKRSLEYQAETANADGTRGPDGEEDPEEQAWQIGHCDHLNIGGSASRKVVGSSYFAYNNRLMMVMAEAVGREQDADIYRRQWEESASAFADKLIDPEGRILNSSQTGYALAFTMGLVPPGRTGQVASKFKDEIDRFDGHPAVGFMGVPRILAALELSGLEDVACNMLLKESYPSWLYPVTQGATSIWERWDSYREDKGFSSPLMNSFNHYPLSSAGAFVFSSLGGIRPELPGYKRITIKPLIGLGLDWAETRYDSIHGPISTAWKFASGRIELNVTIPANTRATVHLPCGEGAEVMESGAPVEAAEGVRLLRMEEGSAVFELGSGSYRFTTAQTTVVS